MSDILDPFFGRFQWYRRRSRAHWELFYIPSLDCTFSLWVRRDECSRTWDAEIPPPHWMLTTCEDWT